MTKPTAEQLEVTEDEDPPCTDCDGFGICYQTEKRCACQPPEPEEAKMPVVQDDADASRMVFAHLRLTGGLDREMLERAFARHRLATEARMAAAVEAERERLLDVVNLWKDSQHAQLKMGEMTAHELRLLRAFVTAISASLETAIRSQSNG